VLRLALLLTVAMPAFAAPKKKPSLVRRVVEKLKPRKSAPAAPAVEVERLGRAWKQFLDGEYAAARKELKGLDLQKLHNRDYALWLLAQSELLTGDAKSAQVHFHDLSLIGGRFQNAARWKLADCLYALGQRADAEKAYEAVLPTAGDMVDPAVARFRIAEGLESRKATAAALTAYRKVVVGAPLHPLAELAFARLRALGGPELTGEERIARAKEMTQDRAWSRALEELAMVPKDAPPQVRDETDYWIGMNKFKMRRDYDLAAQKLLGVWQRLPGDERKADALFHGARAKSRSDDDDGAIVGYREVVAKFPHTRQAAEASFLIGWLEFNRGKFKEAIPGLEENLKRYGSTQWRDDALWYLGFSRWLSGDTNGALADFQKLQSFGGGLTGGKGSYWAARALEKLGKKDDALKTYAQVVATYPFNFYATMSRLRLKELGAPAGPYGDGAKGSPPPLGAIDKDVVADPVIARVDELLAAGMTVEAGFELRRGESDLMKRYGQARALPVLFDRYTRGDDFHRPHQLAETWSGAALKLDPNGDATVRKWWETVYPRAYRAFVEKYAATGDNPPYYLYTIMQKESAYNPHDVSYADAIGLLQMIPPTSRHVAEKIDVPYTDDVLYDPEGNIRFGAWYIGHLLAKFQKQIPLGAGSYNAGPKAMMKWLKNNGTRPLDEFIELCSYTQTREYMKKVCEIYARYVWLYEKADWLPDPKVDASIGDDGIDY
jgi:soluble lytic murein transglycosylase